jgi:hypothetical protein
VIYGWDNFHPDAHIDDFLTTHISQANLKLLTYSKDYGKQAEKSVSTIEKYVPKLIVHASQFYEIDATSATQRISFARGFPSFLFIRLEYNDRSWIPELAADPANLIVHTACIRPSIQSITFTLFGQENPFIQNLTERELYIICKKNCHKYCGFKNLWDNENALFLRMEDLGLWREKFGYPFRKRYEIEIRVTWELDATGYVARANTAGRLVQLRTVAIYESHYLMGDVRKLEFSETM